jgi:hypothetical protein
MIALRACPKRRARNGKNSVGRAKSLGVALTNRYQGVELSEE